MAHMRIVVTLDVDLKEMGAEYGLDKFPLSIAREYLEHDLAATLRDGVAYREALTNIEVK